MKKSVIAATLAALLFAGSATAQIKTTGFDVIIPALLDKKCDAIISAMTDTAARAKQVDFTDYITVGALLMVKKGNPSHVSTLASLSGKSAAVEAATLVPRGARRSRSDAAACARTPASCEPSAFCSTVTDYARQMAPSARATATPESSSSGFCR